MTMCTTLQHVPGWTRRAYRCPSCSTVEERHASLSEGPQAVLCQECGVHMQRYFGAAGGLPVVNYGYRESRYPTEEDARIAQYQFEHL